MLGALKQVEVEINLFPLFMSMSGPPCTAKLVARHQLAGMKALSHGAFEHQLVPGLVMFRARSRGDGRHPSLDERQ